MVYINHEEFSCVDKHKSFTFSSTSIKRINDDDYNTTSSVFTHNSSTRSLLVKMSISINHTSKELDVHKLSSTIPNFTPDNTVCNLKKRKTTTGNDLGVISTSLLSTNKEVSTTSNVFSDIQIYTTHPKYDVCLSLKNKKSRSHKQFYNKRIFLEGLNKVDFMYYLTKRHNFVPVTEKIFSFLLGKDIESMSKVSRIWRNAVKYSPLARKKQKSYLISVKENHGPVQSQLTCSSFPNRIALADISNVFCIQNISKPKNQYANLDSP